MKYLKYFENKKKEIWMVPTKKPYLDIATKKVGADKAAFNWIGEKGEEYILLHYGDYFSGGKGRCDNWTFSSVNCKDFDSKKYTDYPEFMGKVEITQDDIDKYYTEKESEKYNL